ncbi:MAG: arginyltransferase [Desulfobulbus propionicus]|nr:MAG: arginyltransferase [Desulfobulbus propionicus]
MDKYFADIAAACPYGFEERAVYHQGVFGAIEDKLMAHFLATGYRRNGNCMYTMHCPTCSRCIPIRVNPQTFKPNRNQRRVLKKNSDVWAGVAPLAMNRENLNVLDRFLDTRFPGGKSDGVGYYSGFFLTSMTQCFEIRYRLGEQLLGVAIIDCGDSWVNAVYFYFDPQFEQRSPGTLNILSLIDFSCRNGFEYLYLGYWIEGLRGMSYKSAFRPHELLLGDRWQLVA